MASTAKAAQTVEDIGSGPRKLGDVVFKMTRIKKITSKPFKRNPKHDPNEFARQIKNQEDGLNDLTVANFIKNRDEYLKSGRSNTGSAAQKRFREQVQADKIKEYRDQGFSRSEAKQMANKFMEDKAVLHDPDQVAGGFGDKISGLGDKGVNSSLGSQWKNRIGDIDQQVRKAAEDMTQKEMESTYLNIELPWN